MSRVRAAMAYAVLYGLLAATHLLPVNVNTFLTQSRLRALARVVHGAGEFLVFLVSRFLGGPTPVLMFVGLVAVGAAAGLALARLCPDRDRRTAVLAGLALNTAFGIAGVFAGGVLMHPGVVECERVVQGTNLIRMISHTEVGFAPGQTFFLTRSPDGGNSWTEVFEVNVRFPVREVCNRLQVRDSSFQWFWLGPDLAVTHDGGARWDVWQISDLWPDWVCCGARIISTADMRDPRLGTMDLAGTDLPASHLVTEDGGLSWRPP